MPNPGALRGPKVDLTGTTINHWTVLYLEPVRVNGAIHYWCRCSCGEERSVAQYPLRQRSTRSCGHVKRTWPGSHKPTRVWQDRAAYARSLTPDIAGQRFGRLTVVEQVDRPEGGKEGSYWLCSCECGGSKVVRGVDLRKAIMPTSSCGCLGSENRARARNDRKGVARIDMTGQVHGQWTVLRRDIGHSDKDFRWICVCACGAERSVRGAELRRGHSKSCGHSQHKRMGKVVLPTVALLDLRDGPNSNLDALADLVLMHMHDGDPEARDWLTTVEEQRVQADEVYVEQGTPDRAVRRGQMSRAANSTRPDLNSRMGSVPSPGRTGGGASP